MFNNLTKTYSGRIDPDDRNSPWTKIIELTGSSKRVLEVGCAVGYLSEFLTVHRGCRVTGIEINPDAARAALAHCETVIVSDVENGALERASGPFDVVIFADVLEHLRDPWTTLRRSRHLLTDRGYVLISVPNVVHWETRCAFLAGRFNYTLNGTLDNTHLRFFTHRTAVELIRNAGFDIEVFDVVFRGPRYWKQNFYRRWERPINYVVRRFLRGLFAFQFVYKIRPVLRVQAENHLTIQPTGGRDTRD